MRFQGAFTELQGSVARVLGQMNSNRREPKKVNHEETQGTEKGGGDGVREELPYRERSGPGMSHDNQGLTWEQAPSSESIPELPKDERKDVR